MLSLQPAKPTSLRQALADRSALAAAGRDLRYWTSRRATARILPDPTDRSEVRFGTAVTIMRDVAASRLSGLSARMKPILPNARARMYRHWRKRCSGNVWRRCPSWRWRNRDCSDSLTNTLQRRQSALKDQPQHPITPDGRYFVVRGKLYRMRLVHALQYGQ